MGLGSYLSVFTILLISYHGFFNHKLSKNILLPPRFVQRFLFSLLLGDNATLNVAL